MMMTHIFPADWDLAKKKEWQQEATSDDFKDIKVFHFKQFSCDEEEFSMIHSVDIHTFLYLKHMVPIHPH